MTGMSGFDSPVKENWRNNIANSSSPFTAILYSAIGLACAIPAARAASDMECTSYAEKTVAQYAKNLTLGCGFSGLRWHDNKIGHFIFCKAANKTAINTELQVRSALLDQCSGGGSDAEPPVEDQQENIDTPQDDVEQEDAENLQLELDDGPADDTPEDDLPDEDDFIDDE